MNVFAFSSSAVSSPVGVKSRISLSALALLVGVATLLGALLRIAAARGDLWFDEIWTAHLVSTAHSAADVLFHTRYDNNHFTNSLWMWLCGPDASNLQLRSFSIFLGVLTVPAAAMACRRHSDTAAVIAGFVFAIGCFFVHYGSEARGYSAMILSIVAAKAALDRLIEGKAPPVVWLMFIGAIMFGVFSHVTMIEASGALALAALTQTAFEKRAGRGVAIAVAAALASLPGLVCFLYGFLSPDFHLGMGVGFTFDTFLKGLAEAIRTSIGFPEWLGDRAVVALATLAVAGALLLVPAQRRYFPIVAIFVLPALHIIGGLPNQIFPRFHLTAAVALALLASEAGAALWLRGAALRSVAILCAAGFLLSQVSMLGDLMRHGRGDYTAATLHMTAGGPATYTNDRFIGESDLILRHITPKQGVSLRRIDPAANCQERARWLLDVTMSFDKAELPSRRVIADPAGSCTADYVLDAVFQAKGLSGMNWWVYREAR